MLADDAEHGLSPLLPAEAHEDPDLTHILVTGDRLGTLRTLRHAVGRQVRLIYADLPRIEGYDESRSFQSEGGIAWNTWLSFLREHFRATVPLLAEDGVIIVQAGDLEESYAKTLLFEVFGHNNYIGTILWQSHYSPKGGKETTEFATTHENLLCFAYSRSHIARLALPVAAKDYKNPDADPRGPWQAKQKDAGRDTVRMTYNVPPYRWRLVEGSLPPGIWRISPMSGVIWGTPTQVGSYPLRIEVQDSSGNSAIADYMMTVATDGDLDLVDDVWWRAEPPAAEGELTLQGGPLPLAVVGQSYHAVLQAKGGQPFHGSPRPTRGWGFGQQTLIRAILEDRMYFGVQGTAIPETKKYLFDLEDGISYVNVSSWWSGEDVGWTQDATKALNELVDAGIISRTNQTPKPTTLLRRLLDIFTVQGDLVVELFAKSADMMSASLEAGRRSIGLFGSSTEDLAFADECAGPRVKHIGTENGVTGIRWYSLARTALLKAPPAPGADSRLEEAYFETPDVLAMSVLTSQGFFEVGFDGTGLVGETLDGQRRALVLSPEQFLQQDDIDFFVSSTTTEGKRPTIFYFRAASDVDRAQAGRVSLRRIPMDLLI